MKDLLPVLNQIPSTSGWPATLARSELALRSDLHNRLMDLSFRAYEECVTHLLNRLGYEETHLTGRRALRGRTHHGGREIEAFAETGVTRSLVLVQVKQYERPVSRRFVDELRGVMSRRKATHGILVTTSDFASPARLAAQSDPKMPVALVNGAGLVDVMLSTDLGVRRDRDHQLRVDDSYFHALKRHYPQSRAPHRTYNARSSHLSSVENSDRTPLAGSSQDDAEGGPVTWRTHVLAGTTSVWLLACVPSALSLDSIGLALLASAFGALLPDLDASDAKIRSLGIGVVRPFAPLSEAVYRTFGHRGPLHSYVGLIGAAVVALVFAKSLSWPVGFAFWLGYASHLATDACTKSGIPLFSVSARGQRFHLLPAPLRFRTGSQAEAMLLPFLAVATMLLVLTYFPRLR